MLCFHGYCFIKIFLCKHYAKIRHDEVNMRNSFSINFCNPSSFYSLAQIMQPLDVVVEPPYSSIFTLQPLGKNSPTLFHFTLYKF